VLDTLADGIAYLAIHAQLLLFCALRLTWVRKAPVQPLSRAEEHGAGLVGLVARGNHRVKRLVEIPVERLALLS
jgi:hypothetical protein